MADVDMAAQRAARRPRVPKPRIRKSGVPPPPPFDFDALPGSTLLTSEETAARLRVSTATIAFWRQNSDHPLRWQRRSGRMVLYSVADIRAFEALTSAPAKRRRGRPRKDSKRREGAS